MLSPAIPRAGLSLWLPKCNGRGKMRDLQVILQVIYKSSPVSHQLFVDPPGYASGREQYVRRSDLSRGPEQAASEAVFFMLSTYPFCMAKRDLCQLQKHLGYATICRSALSACVRLSNSSQAVTLRCPYTPILISCGMSWTRPWKDTYTWPRQRAQLCVPLLKIYDIMPTQ